MRKHFLVVNIFSAMLFLGGCTVGPDYEPAKIKTNDIWHQKLVKGLTTGQEPALQWWQIFDDDILNRLIVEAKESNHDLEVAYWRVREARALRDFTTGRYYPRIDAIGSYTRSRNSDHGIARPPAGQSNSPYSLHSAGFDSIWEIDIWGQNRRAIESAQASLEAEIENYHDVMISLYAEVAFNYTQLRTAQARLIYAYDNIEAQKGSLELTQSRYDAELTTELDVEQARMNLANTESQVPTLLSAEKAAISRICVLVGKEPSELYDELSISRPIPTMPDEVQITLPAEVLRRRPDIRKSERALAAQTARIGVAQADLYPTFSLSGSFTLTARDFANIGNTSSHQYGFGPSFRWNIFDADRIKNNIRIEEARTQQFYQLYEKTVLYALEEVETSMTDYIYEIDRMAQLEISVQSARRSVQMVQSLYTSGLTDFQNVLDTQRMLAQQEDNLAQSQGAVITNLIRIYKALGGGWDNQDLLKVED